MRNLQHINWDTVWKIEADWGLFSTDESRIHTKQFNYTIYTMDAQLSNYIPYTDNATSRLGCSRLLLWWPFLKTSISQFLQITSKISENLLTQKTLFLKQWHPKIHEIPSLRKKVKENPNDMEAQIYLAKLYIASITQFNKAKKIIKYLTQGYPQNRNIKQLETLFKSCYDPTLTNYSTPNASMFQEESFMTSANPHWASYSPDPQSLDTFKQNLLEYTIKYPKNIAARIDAHFIFCMHKDFSSALKQLSEAHHLAPNPGLKTTIQNQIKFLEKNQPPILEYVDTHIKKTTTSNKDIRLAGTIFTYSILTVFLISAYNMNHPALQIFTAVLGIAGTIWMKKYILPRFK